MIDFIWLEDAVLSEWLINSLFSVVVIALLGLLAMYCLPRHRPRERGAVLIGVFVVLLLMPGLRALVGPSHWNRVDVMPIVSMPVSSEDEVSRAIEVVPIMPMSELMDVMPMPIESREAFTVNVPVILLLVWAAGVLLGLLRLSRGLWRLLRLKGSLQPVQDIRIEALWSEVAGKRGESIALSRGPARTGAFTFGLFHRHVVVASDLLDSVTEREAFTILAHEWAHIENRDTWVGVLQWVALTLYWWLPPVHVMSRQLSLSREMLCDTAAAARVDDPTFYAHSLLNLASQMGRLKPAMGTIGIAGSQSALADRLLTLTQYYQSMKSTLTDKSMLRVPVVVASVAGLLLSFQLGWAQDDVPPVAPEPPTVPDTHEAVWKNLDHKIPVAPSLGLAYAISPIQKTMGIGEERGRPVYENAAKVLREAASKDFRFRQAKLADVVNYLVVEAGIDYVSDLDSQAAGEKFVSFSVTNVSPFRALENLTKHFKLALTFDGILWHVTALDRSPRTEGAEVSEPTLFGPKASVPWSEELRLSGSSADLPVSLFNESDAERKMGEVLPPVLEQPSSAPATIRRSLSLPVEAPRLDVLELPKPQPARVKPVPRIAEPMEPAKPVAPVDVER